MEVGVVLGKKKVGVSKFVMWVSLAAAGLGNYVYVASECVDLFLTSSSRVYGGGGREWVSLNE